MAGACAVVYLQLWPISGEACSPLSGGAWSALSVIQGAVKHALDDTRSTNVNVPNAAKYDESCIAYVIATVFLCSMVVVGRDPGI